MESETHMDEKPEGIKTSGGIKTGRVKPSTGDGIIPRWNTPQSMHTVTCYAMDCP